MQKFINLPRLFLDIPLGENQEIPLSAESSHYLAVVLRMKPASQVRIFNGENGEYVATLLNADKKRCLIKVNQKIREQTQEPGLTLIFCPIRKERVHFLIEKAVELGVTDLRPVITNRTQHKNFNVERAKKHVIEATEQCERLSLATIHEPHSLHQLLSSWDPQDTILFCKERSGSEPVAQTLVNNEIQNPAFLVGPEGGLTTEEALLLESYAFVRPVSLGYNIMRSETAALSALGFWQLYQKGQGI